MFNKNDNLSYSAYSYNQNNEQLEFEKTQKLMTN